MSTATRNTNADEDGGQDVFPPHRSQENGMEMWAERRQGEEENGGQSTFLIPAGRKRWHQKDFWRVLERGFGKLGG